MKKISIIVFTIILLIFVLVGWAFTSNYNEQNYIKKIDALEKENYKLKDDYINNVLELEAKQAENYQLKDQLINMENQISKLTENLDKEKAYSSELVEIINSNYSEPVFIEIDNPFDFDDIRVGYRVRGLTVTKAERYYGDENSYIIHFSGQMTLTGTFINNPDDGYWTGLDFIVSSESLSDIPRLKSEKSITFKIANSDVAEKIIGSEKETGKATITFTDYVMESIPNKPSTYQANFVNLVELH